MLHQQYLGGGFGRRLEADYLIMAALTAKAINKPVKMIYSREADTEFDFTRPMTTMRVTAGSDGKKITGWKHTAASSFATARMAPGVPGQGPRRQEVRSVPDQRLWTTGTRSRTSSC